MGLRHIFGDKPIPRVLDFLLVHRFWDYPISEMENATGVSYRTLQAFIPQLVKQGLVKETRIVGNAKFYAVNEDSQAVRKLHELVVLEGFEYATKESEKHTIKAVARA